MPATVSQTIVAARTVKENEVLSQQDTQTLLRTVTEATVMCECGNPKHQITWVQEDMAKEGTELPEAFYSMHEIRPGYVPPDEPGPRPKRLFFLTPKCAIEYFKKFKPLGPPKKEAKGKA